VREEDKDLPQKVSQRGSLRVDILR
jgi:hypothetical protein